MKHEYSVRVSVHGIDFIKVEMAIESFDLKYRRDTLSIRPSRFADPIPGYYCYRFACNNPFKIRKLKNELKGLNVIFEEES